jgi:hypothetical protein
MTASIFLLITTNCVILGICLFLDQWQTSNFRGRNAQFAGSVLLWDWYHGRIQNLVCGCAVPVGCRLR